jgi:hypothetical protein
MDFKRNGTMPDYVSCPFCQETDFDLIGLKHHFGAGHCDVWNEIPPPPELRPRGLPENARVIASCDLSTAAQETGTARLERINQLMDAKPGTPEGAELDQLADEQVRSEADWLSRPAGGGVAEQLAPVGAASVAPQPTCSKCGAVVRVLESHICRSTANVEYP